jgi:hypothetical protein
LTFTEKVDQFFDDVFNGNVLTYFSGRLSATDRGHDPAVVVAISEDPEIAKRVDGHMKEFGTLNDPYLLTDGAHTEENARKLYRVIIALRLYGVFTNNPNNLNELSYYKTKLSESEKDVGGLRDRLKDAYTANDTLQASIEDLKKGRTGIHQQ